MWVFAQINCSIHIRPPKLRKGGREWNWVIGLSASLLAEGTASLPQLLPGPGQLHPVKQSCNLCSNTGVNLPFTGGGCNSSIGCNARGLILDLIV